MHASLGHICPTTSPVSLQGIEVCLISPGAVRTPIWTKSGDDAAALLAGAPAEAETLYGRLIRQVLLTTSVPLLAGRLL